MRLRRRRPAGTATGGQFAADQRPRPDLGLATTSQEVTTEDLAAEIWRHLPLALDASVDKRKVIGGEAFHHGQELAGVEAAATFLNPHDPEARAQVVDTIHDAIRLSNGTRVDRTALLARLEGAHLTSTKPVPRAVADQHMRSMLTAAVSAHTLYAVGSVEHPNPSSLPFETGQYGRRQAYALAAVSWAEPGLSDRAVFRRATALTEALHRTADIDTLAEIARGSEELETR